MSYGINIEITDGDFPAEPAAEPVRLARTDPYPGWSAAALWALFIGAIVIVAALVVIEQAR